MSKTDFVDFKAIKSALTMEQVLQHYSLLETFKRHGDSLSGPCPIHQGTNRTQFRVSVSKNIWNCFSECKHGGNVLDFIARMENVTIHAAALKAVEWFGLPTTGVEAEAKSLPTVPSAVRRGRSDPPSTAVEPGTPNPPLKFQLEKLEQNHPYLAERGLDPTTSLSFGLGYCAKGMMAGHIAIPIRNAEGQLVAYAGRWPGEPPEGTPKYKLPPRFRKAMELFNLDRASQVPSDQPLVLVEGFFGAIKLWQLGVKRVVALMGSTLSTAQADLIRRHTDSRSRVLVMLDEDEAGRAGREDIVQRLAPAVFIKVHAFERDGQQPEDLTAEEIAALFH